MGDEPQGRPQEERWEQLLPEVFSIRTLEDFIGYGVGGWCRGGKKEEKRGREGGEGRGVEGKEGEGGGKTEGKGTLKKGERHNFSKEGL